MVSDTAQLEEEAPAEGAASRAQKVEGDGRGGAVTAGAVLGRTRLLSVPLLFINLWYISL